MERNQQMGDDLIIYYSHHVGYVVLSNQNRQISKKWNLRFQMDESYYILRQWRLRVAWGRDILVQAKLPSR